MSDSNDDRTKVTMDAQRAPGKRENQSDALNLLNSLMVGHAPETWRMMAAVCTRLQLGLLAIRLRLKSHCGWRRVLVGQRCRRGTGARYITTHLGLSHQRGVAFAPVEGHEQVRGLAAAYRHEIDHLCVVSASV